MRSPTPVILGVVATLSLGVAACTTDPAAPSAESAAGGGTILTSFDQLALARGEHASFRSSLLDSRARLSSVGLTFLSRAPLVARVQAVNGRATVEGLRAGRTWILVQAAGATDSVGVVVE